MLSRGSLEGAFWKGPEQQSQCPGHRRPLQRAFDVSTPQASAGPPQDSRRPCSTFSCSRGAEPESEGTEPSRGQEAALERGWVTPARCPVPPPGGPCPSAINTDDAVPSRHPASTFLTGEEVNPLLRGGHPQLQKFFSRARPKASRLLGIQPTPGVRHPRHQMMSRRQTEDTATDVARPKDFRKVANRPVTAEPMGRDRVRHSHRQKRMHGRQEAWDGWRRCAGSPFGGRKCSKIRRGPVNMGESYWT